MSSQYKFENHAEEIRHQSKVKLTDLLNRITIKFLRDSPLYYGNELPRVQSDKISGWKTSQKPEKGGEWIVRINSIVFFAGNGHC